MSLRMTGGIWRGRTLSSPPDALTTRPTQSKVREAIFSSVQFRLENARVLDLYSGSGALGLEALSRGAASCVFVEKDRRIAKIIRENIESLEAQSQSTVIVEDVSKWIQKNRQNSSQNEFNLIFADPPYDSDAAVVLVSEGVGIENLLIPGGWLILEWARGRSIPKGQTLSDRPGVLEKIKEKIYGDTHCSTFERRS